MNLETQNLRVIKPKIVEENQTQQNENTDDMNVSNIITYSPS